MAPWSAQSESQMKMPFGSTAATQRHDAADRDRDRTRRTERTKRSGKFPEKPKKRRGAMRSRASLVMNRRCSCLPSRRYFCGNLFSPAAEIALPVTSSLLSTASNVHAARPYVWLREFGPFEARPPKLETTVSLWVTELWL